MRPLDERRPAAPLRSVRRPSVRPPSDRRGWLRPPAAPRSSERVLPARPAPRPAPPPRPAPLPPGRDEPDRPEGDEPAPPRPRPELEPGPERALELLPRGPAADRPPRLPSRGLERASEGGIGQSCGRARRCAPRPRRGRPSGDGGDTLPADAGRRRPSICGTPVQGVGKRRRAEPYGSALREKSGGVLLSQGRSSQVPSALEGLTSVFGMGTGVTPPLWPPKSVVNYERRSGRTGSAASRGLHSEHERLCTNPSPRPISTGQLNALLHVHFRPINVVFCHGPYQVDPVGRFILE